MGKYQWYAAGAPDWRTAFYSSNRTSDVTATAPWVDDWIRIVREPPKMLKAVRATCKCHYCGRKNDSERELCEGCNAPLN